MAKVYLKTYGCTLNQADSDIMTGLLKNAGHTMVDNEKNADVVVINSCTVKGVTENKILDRILKLKSKNKKTVVAGCLTVAKEKIKRLNPAAPLVWPSAIMNINNAVNDVISGRITEYNESDRKDKLERIFTTPILRIPIGEGCTSNCFFCQTKIARPKLRSIQQNIILSWINVGVKTGAKEVQLTAMDTGVYGMDYGTNLPELMKCINNLDGVFLTRLGMINPQHALRMADGVLEELSKPKFYKFIHTAVQSGSEKVVNEMKRAHTVAEFEKFVSKARKKIPEITIATDIIVGYPTETEHDFEQTMEMIKRIRPEVVNVSRFSPRPGTTAKLLKQLTTETIKKRSRLISKLIKKMKIEKNKKMLGKEFDVLITKKTKGYAGRTMNYTQILIKNGNVKLGDSVKIRIVELKDESLIGQII